MICPRCRSEYREGFVECADCGIPLCSTLDNDQAVADVDPEPRDPSPGSELIAIHQYRDVYLYLDAANALRRAGIPFLGREDFTGEFRVGKRDQAPYVRTLLVAKEDVEQARQVLAAMAGEI